ncbi:hypothetical protein ACWD6R_02430 [Streptomyces sp. NPDC005151]
MRRSAGYGVRRTSLPRSHPSAAAPLRALERPEGRQPRRVRHQRVRDEVADVLEDEGDPGSVVVRAQQLWCGGVGRESGGDAGFGAVQVGAAGVHLGADHLDERAPPVGEPDPGGDAR